MSFPDCFPEPARGLGCRTNSLNRRCTRDVIYITTFTMNPTREMEVAAAT
jgi:hypothetical protein